MYFNFRIISFCNLTKDPSSLLVEKRETVDLDGVSSQTVYIYLPHTVDYQTSEEDHKEVMGVPENLIA